MNHVEMLGSYGGDVTHALSAWTSTRRDLTPERIARIPALLKDLATAEPVPHGTPFEKSALHFLVLVDTATHIQLLKHRIGVSINGESARYKQHREDKIYVPDDWPEDLQGELEEFSRAGFNAYHEALDRLVASGMSRKRAKESARFFLPYSSQLRFDVMFNFRSFMTFVTQRGDEHAQDEINEVTWKMVDLVRETGEFDASLAAYGL